MGRSEQLQDSCFTATITGMAAIPVLFAGSAQHSMDPGCESSCCSDRVA